ncbi:TPA: hypothetical protein ACS3G7_002782 [Legionella pneumophila]
MENLIPNITYIITYLIPIIATSVITSLITITIAFWKFTYEKKWEVKMAAYKKIMQALYDLKEANYYFYSQYMVTTHCEEETNSNETTKEDHSVLNKLKEAQEELKKISNIEGLFLGVEMVNNLEDLLKGFKTTHKEFFADESNPEELYKKELDLIENCINKIKNWAIKQI